MTTSFTRLRTFLAGRLVGTDPYGNRYYEERRPIEGRRHKRWIVYTDEDDASRVPPEWHAWLHYTVDIIPDDAGKPRREWQKDHVPNQTGTAGAYRPPGHTLQGGERDSATGDYEPWTPA